MGLRELFRRASSSQEQQKRSSEFMYVNGSTRNVSLGEAIVVYEQGGTRVEFVTSSPITPHVAEVVVYDERHYHRISWGSDMTTVLGERMPGVQHTNVDQGRVNDTVIPGQVYFSQDRRTLITPKGEIVFQKD